MAGCRIALMPGDGIGNDLMEATRPLLAAVGLDAEYVDADVGWKYWCSEGEALPSRTVEILKGCRCALFGSITSKTAVEAERELDPALRGKGLVYRSPIIALRKIFDLYCNLRPCKAYPGNPNNYRDDIDLTVFRENTEGLYSEVEFFPLPPEVRAVLSRFNPNMEKFAGTPDDEIAVGLRVITKKAAGRIIRKAFEYARRRGFSSVTLAEKANILRKTSGLMIQEGQAVAADFPGIDLNISYIDAQMMWLIKNPQNYGVIVTSNLFGDIMSDVAAQLVGGLGFAASGNIGDNFAIFEPSHGSAPKYAGKFVVNPCSMILTIKLMLDWLGEERKGRALEKAVAAVIAEGSVRTYDMGGKSSTYDMAGAVTERYRSMIGE